MSLKGSGLLVTGSTSGLGEAIAERFAAEGYAIVVTGRNQGRGQAVAARLVDLGAARSTFIAADLGTLEGPVELAKASEEWLGGVDVLVNNAGIYVVDGTPIGAGEFDAMFQLNVRGAFLLSTTLMPLMAQRGTGVVINVTSPVAYRGYPGMAAYAASKGALDMLTKCWAAEFGRSGIRVNAISPGPVITPGVQRAVGAQTNVSKTVLARTGVVAGRVGEGSDISAAALFLAGSGASYVHGSTLHVDGGMSGVGSLWDSYQGSLD